ncbi:TPA: hypothetical protein ACH3X1_011950 [Trebouxia sp. C0004]
MHRSQVQTRQDRSKRYNRCGAFEQSSFGPGTEGATAVPPQEFADQTDGQAIESSASDILQSGQESPRLNSLEHASAQALSGKTSRQAAMLLLGAFTAV